MAPRLLVGLLVAILAAGAQSGCGKRCDTADGCKRSCSCTDTSRAVTFTCSMIFNCDLESSTCNSEHDLSCEQICDKYAAKNACGRQCTTDEHCQLRCDCEVEGGGVVICEQPFACDKAIGVCEEAHRITTCEGLCQSCYIGG